MPSLTQEHQFSCAGAHRPTARLQAFQSISPNHFFAAIFKLEWCFIAFFEWSESTVCDFIYLFFISMTSYRMWHFNSIAWIWYDFVLESLSLTAVYWFSTYGRTQGCKSTSTDACFYNLGFKPWLSTELQSVWLRRSLYLPGGSVSVTQQEAAVLTNLTWCLYKMWNEGFLD